MSEKTLLLNFRVPTRFIVIGFLLIIVFNFLFLGGTSLHNKYLVFFNAIIVDSYYGS